MKATSKAARLRKIRHYQAAGRPRKLEQERFKCGKIKPVAIEREAKSVVLDARRRVHGLKKADAQEQEAGYVLGRLKLDGKITEIELKAGNRYAETVAEYYMRKGIPYPSPRAQVMFSISGYAGETTEEQAKKARQVEADIERSHAVLARLPSGHQIRTTIINTCVLDYENMRSMPTKQLQWLRTGLRALAFHWGLH